MKKIPPLSPKRLFYFNEVYQCGSINAAADRLDRVQAGIGRQIQQLEQELGTTLFERGTKGRGMVPGGRGRGMVPTEAAHIIHAFYRRYCDQWEKMEGALQDMRQMKRGSVHIATFGTYIDVLLEEVIADFHRQHPSFSLQLKAANSSAHIIRQVLADEAHIGIVHCYADHPDIRCHARATLPIQSLVNRHHPLAARRKGRFAEIAPYPLIFSASRQDLQRIIDSIEYSEKVQLTPAFTLDADLNRKQAAVAGYGGVLMSAFAAHREIQAGQLVPFEIDHPALMSMQAALIVRSHRPLSPAANQLLRLIAGKFPLFQHPASSSDAAPLPLAS